ncbi:hypothetical protein I3842_06G053900 [Carya illinoinensis]|uniref:Uncharacterized protein n=1 Tax=Carya illinoinensis TaxID=32201 RepID=A0A922ESE8_CARIL|nr:hypothetical protein I3842_06G053900 [Carya illinoinensis]
MRLSANVEKRKIDEEIAEKLDVLNFLSNSKTIPSNDFNSLFNALLAERQYFAVGVPGCFHNRLFPESSLHFLSDKNSPICNKGRVHYTNAPHEVLNAYSTQFAMDVENFLNARAKELVPGVMMVTILSGIPTGMPYFEVPSGIMFDFISSILMNMETEGLINEDEVDSFNIPFYAVSPEEMTGLVERNGYFSIERMELTNPATWLGSSPIDIQAWMTHVRAVMEGIFI